MNHLTLNYSEVDWQSKTSIINTWPYENFDQFKLDKNMQFAQYRQRRRDNFFCEFEQSRNTRQQYLQLPEPI